MIEIEVDSNVLILTRGYHWVGRVVAVTALQLVIDRATMFVDIGQIDAAASGRWVDAHGRQIPPTQRIWLYRPQCDVIEWPHELPTSAIG